MSFPGIPLNAKILRSTFWGCTNMDGYICSAIPDGVTDMYGTFNRCHKLKGTFPAFPSSLTDSIYAVYYMCYELEGPLPSIPDGVTNIGSAFSNTHKATAFPGYIPASVNYVVSAFAYASGLNKSSLSAPELWDKTKYPNIPEPTTESNQCFRGLTNLANYDQIPALWK